MKDSVSILIPQPMIPSPHRIIKVRQETGDTFTIETEPESDESGFQFTPGQFNMVYVFGVGEVPLSISGDPSQTKTLTHTIRSVGWVTQALQAMKKGEMIGVRGPFGTPWPLEKTEGNDVLVVAGGVGLAPLRPVIYQLLAQRERYGNVSILYGARSPDDMLFKKELRKWRGRFDLHVDATVDSAKRGWMGNVGVVTQLIAKAKFDPDNTVAMICGPEIMMRFTIKELKNQGMDDTNLYLSMERNMKCAIGFCGHCQFGPKFICKDGPVLRYDTIRTIFGQRQI
jgi:NAD(P)H-flavin reductase